MKLVNAIVVLLMLLIATTSRARFCSRILRSTSRGDNSVLNLEEPFRTLAKMTDMADKLDARRLISDFAEKYRAKAGARALHRRLIEMKKAPKLIIRIKGRQNILDFIKNVDRSHLVDTLRHPFPMTLVMAGAFFATGINSGIFSATFRVPSVLITSAYLLSSFSFLLEPYDEQYSINKVKHAIQRNLNLDEHFFRDQGQQRVDVFVSNRKGGYVLDIIAWPT